MGSISQVDSIGSTVALGFWEVGQRSTGMERRALRPGFPVTERLPQSTVTVP